MKTSDLDKEREVYRAEKYGKVHLEPNCKNADDGAYSLLAGMTSSDTDVCKVCTGDSSEVHSWRDPVVLEYLYNELGMCQREIAEMHGETTPSTVSYHMSQAGLESDPDQTVDDRLDDPDWLREKYIDEELTMAEIAEKAGCSDGTVMRRLHKYDIPVRPSASEKTVIGTKADDADWLREQYTEKELTYKEIAAKTDFCQKTISKQIRKHLKTADGSEGSHAAGD